MRRAVESQYSIVPLPIQCWAFGRWSKGLGGWSGGFGFGLWRWDGNLAGPPPNILCCMPLRWDAACSAPLSAVGETFQGFISASLVSQVAAGDVNSGRHAYPGLGDCLPPCSGRVTPIFWSNAFGNCAWTCGWRLKSCFFSVAGTVWGLWIAGIAKYSPDLWGQLYRIPVPSVRDEVWVFSS